MDGPIEEPLTTLVELKDQGLIRHIGLSNVTAKQVTEAQAITEIACVQNFYNVAQRKDDPFIADLALKGSLMFRFSRWEGSLHCNRRPSTQPQRHSK